MTKFLINRFLKGVDPNDTKSREKFGILSGGVGIFCNVILSIVKFIIGTITNSVSITADAANNLSDASSNIVTIAGAKLASKPVDDDHPFGHGRIEYISALIVSFLIFLMGFELGKSSITKIIHPEDVKFNWIAFAVLIVAIPVKLWMAYFNNKLYKISNNGNMKAVKQDSINDCLATGATIIALVVSAFTKYNIDGYIGLAVAVIIIIAGIGIIKDIISNLIGKAPDPEIVEGIEKIILDNDVVVGVHDLIVHDYGPGRIIASAHAEVPCNKDIMYLHDVIDNIERKIANEMNIVICIHMDPIVVNDKKVDEYKEIVKNAIEKVDSKFTFHDFRIVDGPTHTNVIFDLVIPHQYPEKPNEILKDIRAEVKKVNNKIFVVATVEHSYL